MPGIMEENVQRALGMESSGRHLFLTPEDALNRRGTTLKRFRPLVRFEKYRGKNLFCFSRRISKPHTKVL